MCKRWKFEKCLGNGSVDALRQGARRWSCGLGHVLPLTTRMSNDGNRQSSLTSAAIRSSSGIISVQTHSVCIICDGKDLNSCSCLFELDLRFYSLCLFFLLANSNTITSQCKQDFWYTLISCVAKIFISQFSWSKHLCCGLNRAQ